MPETRGLYASFILLIVRLTVLAIINWLLTGLPMIKAISIPGLPVALPACIAMVIGIVMIVVLLMFRSDFVPRLRARYPGLPDLSDMVSDAISLAVVVIGYNSFNDIIKPMMKEYSWAYAPIFLVIALWPLISLITVLARSARPIGDWVSGKIASNTAYGRALVVKCASCGKLCRPDTVFCPDCGTRVADLTENIVKCAACGASNRSPYKYCTQCGASMAEDEQYDTQVSI
jgi:uncharacterized membrane protein YidH (DUF202 family)